MFVHRTGCYAAPSAFLSVSPPVAVLSSSALFAFAAISRASGSSCSSIRTEVVGSGEIIADVLYHPLAASNSTPSSMPTNPSVIVSVAVFLPER